MEWTRGPTIGRGSTATVSLATSISSGELFAVKSSELSRSMFLQKEQHLLSKLSSPYIVKYMGCDISEENNKVMYNLFIQFASGGTLHDAILRNGGQLDEPMIRSYTQNILQGLNYLHTNGLVHCDIKSHNVLIDQDGGAKIADFGCARVVSGDDKSAFSGTPMFMSPEAARGEEQGFAADVWAVGCTVLEMATGKNPWTESSDDPVSALYRIGFSNEVPEIPIWLSEKGKDFLRKCLRRDPSERWTAKELLGHPFLDDLDDDDHLVSKEFIMSSPSCVLDQDYWGALESPQNLTLEVCSSSKSRSSSSSSSNSAEERIKSLIGCDSSSSSIPDFPNWGLEEDWITVRNSDIEEENDNAMFEDELSAETMLILSDSIISGQELDHDFVLEFNVENNISIIIPTDDFVLENFNLEIFINDHNDNSCFLQFLDSLILSLYLSSTVFVSRFEFLPWMLTSAFDFGGEPKLTGINQLL